MPERDPIFDIKIFLNGRNVGLKITQEIEKNEIFKVLENKVVIPLLKHFTRRKI